MKIIQIDGIKGFITVSFISICLFAGFVIFPGFIAMYFWNKYLAAAYMFPVLNLFQGVLLWGIAVISYCIFTQKDFAISYKETPELSDEEINKILQSVKFAPRMHVINKVITQHDKSVKGLRSESKDDDKISNIK